MTQPQSDFAISTVSVAAIFTHVWLPPVHAISTSAAEWLPILGGISLGLTIALRGVQIWRELKRHE